MGLENARDSFVDLLEVKKEKQERQQHEDKGAGSSKPSKKRTSFRVNKGAGGATTGASSSACCGSPKAAAAGFGGYGGGTSGIPAFSGRRPATPTNNQQEQSLTGSQELAFFATLNDLCYEPCEVEEEDEEHWPLWEMTGDDPWADQTDASIAAACGGGLNSNNLDRISSIVECERIFTVPEVYDEIMQQRHSTRMSSMTLRNSHGSSSNGGSDQRPCHKIFNCFNPWKQQTKSPLKILNEGSHQKNDPFVDLTSPSGDADQQDEYNEDEVQLNPKGAIKRSSMAVQLYLGMPASVRQSFTPSMFKVRLDEQGEEIGGGGGDSRKRHSIVGNDHNTKYATGMNGQNAKNSATVVNKKKYKVHFSELKRVLRVRKFMSEEATEVWFQREDFDYFKNEMTLLIQEDGASRELAETWLEAQECANRRGSQTSLASGDEEGDNGLSRVDSNVSSNSTDRHGNRKSRSWWHEYDHSRRGLERYASPGQARQILASYKVALQKVLMEQNRQRLLCFICIPGARDPEKIAEVYHEYTSWSRDLALAAGASDADAVRTDFDDDKRHTREYYMLKQGECYRDSEYNVLHRACTR